MENRKFIKRFIKYKLFLNKVYHSERYFVNFFALCIFILIFITYKTFLSFDVYFYDVRDIQKLDIEKETLKNIYQDSVDKNIEFEKILALYSKDNNYFTKDAYIEDYNSEEKRKFRDNISFGIYSLNKENRDVYQMIRTINSEIKNLPIKQSSYSDVVIVNSFNYEKNSYGTLLIETVQNKEEIPILSVSDGVIVKVGYNGEEGLRVVVESESGTEYTYTNLDDVNVNIGGYIEAGNVIGFMGNSKQIRDGIVYERRKLTFYINYDKGIFVDNSYINPYPFLYINNID